MNAPGSHRSGAFALERLANGSVATSQPVDEPPHDSSPTRRTTQHRLRVDSRTRSWAAGLASLFDSERFQAVSMESAETGGLPSASP